jgi:hypothetical protein
MKQINVTDLADQSKKTPAAASKKTPAQDKKTATGQSQSSYQGSMSRKRVGALVPQFEEKQGSIE